MKLSVLICTTYDRRPLFDVLYAHILGQLVPDAEVLYDEDNKEISVGAKRQNLLERATGDFICFVDSDDLVPGYYVERILKAISETPGADCVGFQIKCFGCEGVTADASMKYKEWAENQADFDYVRHTYHKTPVRREIALAVGFEDMRYGEDYKYSMGLRDSGLLKTEAYIDAVMYEYRFKYEDPKTKFGM